MLHDILLKTWWLQVLRQALIQVAYAIGVAEPVGIYVNTYETAKVKDTEGNH